MPVQDSIVCPDCGAAYQCKPEQLGKLLHCKCGRYLVVGSNNLKSPSLTKPAAAAQAKQSFGVKAAPKTEPSFGVKTGARVAPKQTNSEQTEKVVREAAAVSSKAPAISRKLMFGGAALAIVAAIGVGIVFFRPSVQANSAKPVQSVSAPVQAATPAANPCSGIPFRLENGTSLAHSRLGNGMGKLEVENATPSDVAVRVTGSANLTVAWVYIQQGQKAMIDNIPLGTQRVLVASGSDWDGANLTFKCNDVYAVFDAPLDYTDRREDDRTTYSAYKLVLGRQRTTMISKGDFFKGHLGQ